jgi:hypothetical protein
MPNFDWVEDVENKEKETRKQEDPLEPKIYE